jgi:putative nucleotidyltransferase with HDIG domain
VKHVLFVDDDQAVLDGLRRMLRSMRHEWDTAFVTSGVAALDWLDRQPVDVLVTDMRMPDMDGAQLLEHVMRRHPDVVRIVLSGQVDRESALRAIGPTHQYLSKPCDEATLKATISRALTLRQWLLEPTVKHIVAQVTALPHLPSLYTKLVEELQGADCSMKRVGEIIGQDVGMAAKIMQLVNSSYFGLRQRAGTPQDAAALLGIDALRSLVLSVHVFGHYQHVNPDCCRIEQLYAHSVEVGTLSKRLAREAGAPASVVNDAFTAGMLHDVGKLLLASQMEHKYLEVIALVTGEGLDLTDAEGAVLGCSHAEAGAYLLGLWGLPDAVVQAVSLHHSVHQPPPPDGTPLGFVQVANRLAHDCDRPIRDGDSREPKSPTHPPIGAPPIEFAGNPSSLSLSALRSTP